ncbi:hypothetical protein [Flavobacterium sp. K5-23]|uniref:hypothetical protein n=1 Tax=Flavobacterium sp. K5-23 TaxID=2746225 RepID=UPI00200E0368|nr:hypothetical protein [Flavobacterium sp. K5-23]UQD56773.1 hypothetical protein FLAK523_10375 [Flavobacterium sp. K5-23]
MNKLLILILFLFTSLKSYSCDCSGFPNVSKNWESANEVFTGEIIKVDSLLYGNNGAKIYSFTVKILKSYKSEIYKGRELRTILSQSSASCDFMFQLGKVYLIYAKRESQTLACSICSRTNILKNVEKEEIQTLEKLHEQYKSEISGVRSIKLENNISYQIGLVKNSFEEKVKSKDQIIYILLGLIILLIIIAIILTKRNNNN